METLCPTNQKAVNGKKTPGVDGKASLTFKERFDLDNLLKTQAHTWTHSKLREIPNIGSNAGAVIETIKTLTALDSEKLLKQYRKIQEYCDRQNEELGFVFSQLYLYIFGRKILGHKNLFSNF